jgi:hypothetical protein
MIFLPTGYPLVVAVTLIWGWKGALIYIGALVCLDVVALLYKNGKR